MDLRDIINKISSFDDENIIIENVLKQYSINELFTFDSSMLSEDVSTFQNDNWDVDYSNAFKKGMKKHGKNNRVSQAFKELENFIIQQPNKPQQNDYPHEFNVHIIKRDDKFVGAYSAHLMGKKIITLFYVENSEPKNKLRWVFIGTHQEANPNW